MNRVFWTCCTVFLLGIAGVFLPSDTDEAWGQWGGTVSSRQFELADTVQLDQVDNAVLAQWERAKTLLADRQWDEAVEILGQLAESSDGKLLGVTDHRYVNLRAWCQMQLAAMPPDALNLYRARVDPVARKWYEQGIVQRNVRLLRNVVEQAFASRYGDDALWALGEIALESGDYATARWYWERILPVALPTGTPTTCSNYPDTDIDLAAVRAWLVLTSILEGAEKKGTGPISRNGPEGASQKLDLSPFSPRARAELAEFARLHPNARGRLGRREGKFVNLLGALVAESTSWPALPVDPNWPTFAGNPRRNRIASPLVDVGAVAWRVRLRPVEDVKEPKILGLDRREPLSFHPLQIGNKVLVNDSQKILAVRLDTGEPAWGRAAIYQGQLARVIRPSLPSEVLGVPRYTMTVFQDRLFARMGSPVTSEPQGTAMPAGPGCLVCLDMAAEGRLVWKAEPEEGFSFEGAPVADADGVYVAMRRQDIRPQAFVACFNPDTGQLRWRRFICGAETPARGVVPECTHNLLTLGEGMLYYNTNLGAVVAVRAEDGHTLWISLYPRARRGNTAQLAAHWRRDLNPCILEGGMLLVAPADSPRIFAFDAAGGQMLWQTGTEVEDAVDLLGVAGRWLIAGGGKLYWISLREEDRGRVKHVWPDGPERPGYGRGVLAGQNVLWPTHDKLYVFDQKTTQLQKVIDLGVRGASGGNLLVVKGQLLIATENELIAIGIEGGKMHKGEGL